MNCLIVNNQFLTPKEKLVMKYLAEVCVKKKTYLVSPADINTYVSKKYILSVAELDEIMVHLGNLNYIDFVVSDGRRGYHYCVSLKRRGQNFLADLKRQRKANINLILRTVLLSVLSFVLGLILKAIFNG